MAKLKAEKQPELLELSDEEIQERVLQALAEVLGAGHLDWKKHPQQNAPTTDRIQ